MKSKAVFRLIINLKTQKCRDGRKATQKGAAIAIITVSVIIILAVLGFVGCIVYNEIFAEKINNTKPATADEITTAATTVPPTTVAPTTQPTTVAEKRLFQLSDMTTKALKINLRSKALRLLRAITFTAHFTARDM